MFKHAYNGNWKLMLENHLDGAHPAWVHASSVAVARNAPEPGKPGEEHYFDIAVRQMRQNGAPESVWENDRHLDDAARPRLHGRLPRRQPPGRRAWETRCSRSTGKS